MEVGLDRTGWGGDGAGPDWMGGGMGPDRTGWGGGRTGATSAEQRLPIKDQGSRIRDLGPCFGMNGHFRRDPDVIARQPESTIDFLSVYIGFGS